MIFTEKTRIANALCVQNKCFVDIVIIFHEFEKMFYILKLIFYYLRRTA